jgi:hypothetical protein
MGEMRNVYRILVVKPEGRRPLGRHKLRWEDSINIDLKEIERACTEPSSSIKDAE